MIELAERLDVGRDQPDSRYTERAVTGGANYLVAADKLHLLPIGEYPGA